MKGAEAIFVNCFGKGITMFLNFTMDKYLTMIKVNAVNEQYINFINQVFERLGLKKNTVTCLTDSTGKPTQAVQTSILHKQKQILYERN